MMAAILGLRQPFLHPSLHGSDGNDVVSVEIGCSRFLSQSTAPNQAGSTPATIIRRPAWIGGVRSVWQALDCA
jgi:hypothetical protein